MRWLGMRCGYCRELVVGWPYLAFIVILAIILLTNYY